MSLISTRTLRREGGNHQWKCDKYWMNFTMYLMLTIQNPSFAKVAQAFGIPGNRLLNADKAANQRFMIDRGDRGDE